MKRSDAETAIQTLATRWAREVGIAIGVAEQPSFSAFQSWAEAQGFGHYFTFRSTVGARYDAEQWFDQELGQTWRN